MPNNEYIRLLSYAIRLPHPLSPTLDFGFQLEKIVMMFDIVLK